MVSIKRELIERINHLDAEKQRRVLEFVRNLEEQKTYTASELMQLPPEERDRIVIEALARSANQDVEYFDVVDGIVGDDE